MATNSRRSNQLIPSIPPLYTMGDTRIWRRDRDSDVLFEYHRRLYVIPAETVNRLVASNEEVTSEQIPLFKGPRTSRSGTCADPIVISEDEDDADDDHDQQVGNGQVVVCSLNCAHCQELLRNQALHGQGSPPPSVEPVQANRTPIEVAAGAIVGQSLQAGNPSPFIPPMPVVAAEFPLAAPVASTSANQTPPASNRKRHLITCTYAGCTRSCSNHAKLLRHIERRHSGQSQQVGQQNQQLQRRPFRCQVPGCGQTFKCQADLQRHAGILHATRPFFCTPCNRGFIQKGNLTMHNRSAKHRRVVELLGGGEEPVEAAAEAQIEQQQAAVEAPIASTSTAPDVDATAIATENLPPTEENDADADNFAMEQPKEEEEAEAAMDEEVAEPNEEE